MTDSEYLRRGITEFLPRWKENGWHNSARKPVANQDLLEQLEELVEYQDVTWLHVRGHPGQPEQERCDALATVVARRVKELQDLSRFQLPAVGREDRRGRTGRVPAAADKRPVAR
jgi:ribonuclease HI